ISAALHLGRIPIDRVLELTPLLFAAAASGDAVAASVVLRQAEEVVALARVAADQLGLRAARHHVVLGGGVLRARHPLLHEAVLAGVQDHARWAEVTVVTD